MGAEAVNAYFTPVDYILYLFALFALMVAYYLWKWHKIARDNIKVIVVRADGSTNVYYTPKQGNSVTITNPETGDSKLWAINKLSTFDMLYPGDGFIPVIFQKIIRTTIVDETDWEPLINRSDYEENVASPDVKKKLMELAASLSGGKKEDIEKYASDLITAPTRAMIADPSFIGNLFMSKVAEMAASVFREFEDKLKAITSRFDKMINPTVTYLLIGLTIIGIIAVLFITIPAIGNLQTDIDSIKQSLGVVGGG